MLDVPKKVAKVNVEQVARGGDHDVVVVSITNTLCIVNNGMQLQMLIPIWYTCNESSLTRM